MKKIISIILIFSTVLFATNKKTVESYLNDLEKSADNLEYMRAVSLLNAGLISGMMIPNDMKDDVKSTLEDIQKCEITHPRYPSFKLFAIVYKKKEDNINIYESYINDNGYVKFAKRVANNMDDIPKGCKFYNSVKKELEQISEDAEDDIYVIPQKSVDNSIKDKKIRYFFEYINKNQCLGLNKLPRDKGISSNYSKLYKINGETFSYGDISPVVFEKVERVGKKGDREIVWVMKKLLKLKEE